MPIKLTEEEVSRRAVAWAEKSNLLFVGFDGGKYVRAKNKVRLFCEKHGELLISFDKLTSGTGCTKCGNERVSKLKLTSEKKIYGELKIICEDRGWKFVGFCGGKFNGVESKAIISCNLHGEFQRRIACLKKNKYDCPECARVSASVKNRYSEDLTKSLWELACKRLGFEFLGFESHYSSADNTRGVVMCAGHGSWTATYSNFVLSGNGCSTCSRVGFDYNGDGYLYALSGNGLIKIGISNNPKNRIKNLKKSTPFSFDVIDVIQLSSGAEAKSVERSFHKDFLSANLTGFDGATEWLKFDVAILERLRST